MARILMSSTIDSIRALRVMPKVIEAAEYNQVRLALRRLGNPLRVALPDHRGLEIILDDRHWLCVDGNREDLPVMAWTDFDTREHNQAIHVAVPCQLRLYHMHAGLVMGSALEALRQALSEQLAASVTPGK
jgi:hypothetical protein